MISRSRGESAGSRWVARARQQRRPQARVDVGAAVGDRVERGGQLARRALLERVAARAGVQAVEQQLGVARSPCRGRRARSGSASSSSRVSSIPDSSPQPDVDERDVGLGALDELAALVARAGGADDLEALAAEQQLEPLAQRFVVFDEDEPEGHRSDVYRGVDVDDRSKIAKSPPRQGAGGANRRLTKVRSTLAKDTEKLIRQLSLISYLMAERRPVTATEIRRDVEGYSDMTEDAFARRFYADRAELDSLGIHLTVDKPADGFSEQENYSLAPEAFHLPAIEFSDTERPPCRPRCRCSTASSPMPSRCGWRCSRSPGAGRARSTRPPSARSASGSPPRPAGPSLGRLAKVDTAIHRRKRIEFEYFTMQTGETEMRKVDPYLLLFEGGQFYLVGHSHERRDPRVPALADPRYRVIRHDVAIIVAKTVSRRWRRQPAVIGSRNSFQAGTVVGWKMFTGSNMAPPVGIAPHLFHVAPIMTP